MFSEKSISEEKKKDTFPWWVDLKKIKAVWSFSKDFEG